MKRKYEIKITIRKSQIRAGSALILAVFLTSMLAIVGILFLMVARVDKISTSAITENKELNSAVETVIATISQQLVDDLPYKPNQEYYDYPDVNNPWLANLEPEVNSAAGEYQWRQISDIYNKGLYMMADLPAAIILNYQYPIDISDSNAIGIYPADADGDGVSDSVWVKLDGITTNKGKPIFAAIRVIDNSAMLNLNTAYIFDPTATSSSAIDGSSQMQINLMALSWHPGDPCEAYDMSSEADLLNARNPDNLGGYEENVIWQYGNPSGAYTPFDISDELELRNRFLLNNRDIDTRLEEVGTEVGRAWWWRKRTFSTPAESGDLDEWFISASADGGLDPNYAYRHIATTYNMDRIINPVGPGLNNGKMINVNRLNPGLDDPNDPDVWDLYDAIRAGFIETGTVLDVNALAAQIAVNIKDAADPYSDVSVINVDNVNYLGFERPCIFISELVHSFKLGDAEDPDAKHGSFAIELYKRHPQFQDKPLNLDNWQLVIDKDPLIDTDPLRRVSLVDNIGNYASDARRYRVIIFQDPNAPLDILVKFSDSPEDGETGVDPEVELNWPPIWLNPDPNNPNSDFSYDIYFGTDYNDVKDANNFTIEFKGNQTTTTGNRSYTPGTSGPPLDKDQEYFWRIDDIVDTNVISTGDVWEFTTWEEKPDVIEAPIGAGEIIFETGSTITLERRVQLQDGSYVWFPVDSVVVPTGLVRLVDGIRSFQRDMARYRFLKRLWSPTIQSATLGHGNRYSYPPGATEPIAIHLSGFNNVGQIGKVFRQNVYSWPWAADTSESDVRINLADPAYQQIFRYLTRFNLGSNETRIKGRININTAPWYVIAQLPWVTNVPVVDAADRYKLAQAIVAYREKLDLSLQGGPNYYQGRQLGMDSINSVREERGFASVAELVNVTQNLSAPTAIDPNFDIRKYARDYIYNLDGTKTKIDQLGFPDISINSRTRRDGAANDFEERDLIFSRISDLVTVRSDVFTAYILVRIGTDGPQKRVIAILDRSQVKVTLPGVPNSASVKVITRHPVGDPW